MDGLEDGMLATERAEELGKKYKWSVGHVNAFRHSYFLALFTAKSGGPNAMFLGGAHEMDVVVPGHEWGSNNSVIDMHNNTVGICTLASRPSSRRRGPTMRSNRSSSAW
jgi:hypothetical protein